LEFEEKKSLNHKTGATNTLKVGEELSMIL